MKKLYKFHWDCGYGDLDGMFLATDVQIDKVVGKEIYFGEVLGKHSEIYGTLDAGDLTVISDDQAIVSLFRSLFKGDTISGYNPVVYYEEAEEDV